ncbi:MAG: DUF5060 domain-containing protein [Bacteroidota bacterium]
MMKSKSLLLRFVIYSFFPLLFFIPHYVLFCQLSTNTEASKSEDGFIIQGLLATNHQARETVANQSVLWSHFRPEFSISQSNVVVKGEMKKWHKVTLTFDGPEVAEDDEVNPFLHYRLDVLFTHAASDKTYLVPGYFAADGNAGETSATSGNKWRVHFTPDEIGRWAYKVTFRKGNYAALLNEERPTRSALHMDGITGTFSILPTDKAGRDLRSKGRLQYVEKRYLKFAETGAYFLKAGPDAPENFLSYADFDGTFHDDGHKDHLVKTWSPHAGDWNAGDPHWQDGKGKAMIGAINYLASEGLNSFSFLTMNILGDDQNVFPFTDYDTYDRYDCSKLDQWEVIFAHAEQNGMFLHFKLMENENQGLLDNGGIGTNTQLYYREMIARFGHHLALNWNVGEEIGEWARNHKSLPMKVPQRRAAAEMLRAIDPYDHHIVIHNGELFDELLGDKSLFSGISLQTHKGDFSEVHEEALHWINASKEAGKQWAVAVDEPGNAKHALLPDVENPKHDNARINGLWGAFMAGAWGTEWYFGYEHVHSDLTCEDYRSRDLFWDQCRHLLDFFQKNQIPFWETENQDRLVADGDYCLAVQNEVYVVFLRHGSGSIDLSEAKGNYDLWWYNPRESGVLDQSKTKQLKGGKVHVLTNPPKEVEKDWVVLIKKTL